MTVLVNGLSLTGYPWSVTHFKGWTDTAPIEMETEKRLGHGSFSTNGSWSGRAINLRGNVWSSGREQQEQQRDLLAGLAPRGLSFPVSRSKGGRVLHGDFQLSDVTVFDPVTPEFANWELFLYSEDPYLYSEWRESSLYPIGAGVGFDFPAFSRGGVATFGTAVSTGERIWNDGNADSTPIFTVTADSAGFAVGVGSKRVTYPWPTYMDVPVTVDMAGAVTVGGVDQSHLLGERGWGSVPPRSTEAVHFSFLNGGTGWANVRHRDTNI